MRVLDVDMDYFMREIAHTPFSVTDRLSEDEFGECVWSEKEVREFIENNLGMSKERKIRGRIVKDHDESLYFWEELVSKKMLKEPFEVVHVDLGLGLATGSWLQESLFLADPIEKRREKRTYKFAGKNEKINMGDYLLWAVAYRMVSKIDYCSNPNGEHDDYSWQILKDFEENRVGNKPVTNIIQLKYNSKKELPKGTKNENKNSKKEYLQGCIRDPEVPLHIIPNIEDVNYDGDFDFAVLAQSPNYTPQSADFIMDIFREYIIEL